MAIVKTVSKWEFISDFYRSEYKDNFTENGLVILFDYLEELSECTGENIELNLCAIACDFSEDGYETIRMNYRLDLEIDFSDMDADETREAIIEYLQENTTVCGYNDETVVFSAF